MLTEIEIDKLRKVAINIRESIVKMLLEAGSGHAAGPLGLADFFTYLYCGGGLKISAADPWHEGRDRFLVSCGHVCPVWYAALAEAGFFSKKELLTLRQVDSRLQGHPHAHALPGLENTSGPLGQGLSVAVGMALAATLKKQNHKIFCLMSDGEQAEGQVWEAAMSAGKYKLSNLIGLIDRNHIQISGTTENVMPLESLSAKYTAFNWRVLELKAHDFNDIENKINLARAMTQAPTLIILHTIPGRGVDFMEQDFHWHGKAPTASEALEAWRELEKARTLNGHISLD